jgi:tRNA pseudouridine38-40 synthase
MTIRVKITIEYDGSIYVGWQKQRTGRSVQQEIESSLEKLFNEKINIFVSGRTDAGVHAMSQVAHFDLNQNKVAINKISFAVNHLLNKKKNKIVILKSQKVSQDFNARFSVKEKTYLYKILNRSTPSFILENKVWFIPQKLSVDIMRNHSRYLVGKFNFNAFRSSHCQAKTSIRSIKDIKIKKSKDIIEIRVVGKSFLHNQVRIIVGTLVNLGKETFEKNKILQILKSKDRRKAGPTAPACGLYLEKIKY